MKSKILILSLLSNLLFSQSRMNLGFENVSDNNKMLKWRSNKKNQSIEIDTLVKFEGNRSLKITGESISSDDKNDFAVVMQTIPKKYLNGKEFVLKARIKSKSNFDGVAFPYLRTLDKDKKNVSFLNQQDKPVKGNTDWQEVTIKIPILENVENLDFGFVYKGKGIAWFDKVEILLDGKPIEKPVKELTPEQITAIKKYVYPLSSFEPTSSDNTDLEILKTLVGNSKVVALGEATHGTSEIYKMKDRLTRYLVKNHKFDIFSLEAYMQQAYLANDYTIKNTATLNEALQNLVFFVWKTEEMSTMLQWMKQYNNGSQKILFTGFDMQDATEPIKQLYEAFSEDKDIVKKIEKLSSTVKEFAYENRGNIKSYILKKEQADIIYPIIAELKTKINENSKFSTNDKSWQTQNVRIIEQLLEKSSINRDKFMAENFLWIKEHNPNSKFIISAHNGHVNTVKNRMGKFLKDKLQNDYKTFGFAFFDGEYTARGTKDKMLATQTAQKPYLGTYEYWMNSLNVPYFILDLNEMKKDNDLSWLVSDLDFRSVGHTKPLNEFYQTDISDNYDYLIFINKSTSAKRLE
ncbi:erythromycin esterase family protein [Riemerella anatipestifer]|uniref:erythromycin esterase family protein n=1 Tax=Riemerella anatipestifer TaxID=34085 RepID=UPI0012ADC350|nr:erythromycin esterase family protein [Riemerella anatipestifer]USL96101.1 erythromycin esterase family protein [Riemerella anatipestifer]